ncbi:hypothetical protein LPB72_06475 [Hydrogenophaga crassostreae]|uniref:HTH araC/xylS-type domain-containing protein n=1 Tax=Hydrogenophaga crassostreae TaxID=1763535 RepID=A0A167IJB1_9BURK|nr:helix-turn-helix domain-containing protein [Hydrogenophaga crassostreae]AOW15722.1 hypothetical protein LPB072_16240 [Hydrogenophaga crassostreae]OAD42927.1 hypothetical protein LPB72_06475 [Hydrogenophaga crassostreae]
MPSTPKAVAPSPLKPHRVVVLALPGLIAFDLTIALEVFGRAMRDVGMPCYQVSVCGEMDELDTGLFGIRVKHGLEALSEAQTIIVPGTEPATAGVTPVVMQALRKAHRHGVRLASICSGAFALAEAGLLDGLRVTTHWKEADSLARLYPQVEVNAKVLFIDEGQVLTSAGAAAGLDLCLHMVRRDFGAAVAAQVARLSVIPLQREGGQAQFIQPQDLPHNKYLEPLMTWALGQLHRPLSLDALAKKACSSQRTLNRRFQEQLGMSPAQWLSQARIQRAQTLLETTPLTIEDIVSKVGLGSAANFRAQFHRVTGVSPSNYRRNFGPQGWHAPATAFQLPSERPVQAPR